MSKYDNKNTIGWKHSLWFWEGDEITTIGKHCGSTRDLPLPAETFHETMDEKTEDGSPKIKFSFEGDRMLIIGLYTKTYTAVVACAVDFDWKGLGWSCDMSMLMPVLLAAASTLKKLDISHNAVEGELPPSIGKLTGLMELNCSKNRLRGELPPTIGQLKANGCKVTLR